MSEIPLSSLLLVAVGLAVVIYLTQGGCCILVLRFPCTDCVRAIVQCGMESGAKHRPGLVGNGGPG
jgi:hypothetical protein